MSDIFNYFSSILMAEVGHTAECISERVKTKTYFSSLDVSIKTAGKTDRIMLSCLLIHYPNQMCQTSHKPKVQINGNFIIRKPAS